jgi:hypothetical protein
LVLGERSPTARHVAFAIVSALALAGLAGIWLLRDLTTPWRPMPGRYRPGDLGLA